MWPSDYAIKKTLSGINELSFNTVGCLTLSDSHFSKNLERTLIQSAIQTLNFTLKQEKKLILANQLRHYIVCSHHEDKLKSKKLSLWKNFIQFYNKLNVYTIGFHLLFIALFLSSFTWPILLSGLILIGLGFTIKPFIQWLLQRINYVYAKKSKIKSINQLNYLIELAKKIQHPVNPLFITPQQKLFETSPFQALPEFPPITTYKLIEALTQILDAPFLSNALMRHIGSDASYTQKESLKKALEQIYYRLKGDLDLTLGPPSEKEVLINKLKEGIDSCTPGFHNRVNTILESFHQPQNFSALLYLVRKDIVEQSAIRLMTLQKKRLNPLYEIHTFNDFSLIAKKNGLGIKPILANDCYRGDINPNTIQTTLQSEFETHYTLFNLPLLLTQRLRGLLIKLGYSGVKKPQESYTLGDMDCEVEKMTALIKRYLPMSSFQSLHWSNFFIIDDETLHILDIHWANLNDYFFIYLLEENYFNIPPFSEFLKNFLDLLVNNTPLNLNYLCLLAQYYPESLNLLFYYLKNYSLEAKAIKKQLINLFFEKNECGQNAIQVAAQYHPTSLDILLNFIHENRDQFDLNLYDLILTEKFQTDSLKTIFDFLDNPLNYFKKNTITAFFIEKNDRYWNSFIQISREQPKAALITLNYIIKHPHLFTRHPSLFKENSDKIQHALLNLITIQKPDSESVHILLSFISFYSELLNATPKKVAHFILNSLNIINTKLIDDLFESHGALLLKCFSSRYFAQYDKNADYILRKLLSAYHNELTQRAYHNPIYTHPFRLGFSVHEKLNALEALLNSLETSSYEKKDLFRTFKKTPYYPALTHGRLSQFFQCCYNENVAKFSLKMELQR